jgi:hypothetical protein
MESKSNHQNVEDVMNCSDRTYKIVSNIFRFMLKYPEAFIIILDTINNESQSKDIEVLTKKFKYFVKNTSLNRHYSVLLREWTGAYENINSFSIKMFLDSINEMIFANTTENR